MSLLRLGRLATRRRIALAVLALVLFWAVSSGWVAWKLIHRQRPPRSEVLPVVAWGEIEEHRIKTADGEDLGAWLVRGTPEEGVVLLLHGNGGARSSNVDLLKLTHELGYSVLALSLRCHGDSTGEINDFGFSARHDVMAAVQLIEHECPGRTIYVVGRSLGAAAAVYAARDLADRVAAYVLEQPYKDLASATRNRLEDRLPAGLDAMAYCGLRMWAPLMFPADAANVSLLERVVDIPTSSRVLVLAGSEDRHARLADVTSVYERIADRAELVVFDGAPHVPLHLYDRERYAETLMTFLNGGARARAIENAQP